VEFVADCRTDETSGRDEKDVDVRSCSCGVAEKKSAARMAHAHRGLKLTRLPEPYSIWNGALLGCAGARMVLSTAGIVQQQLNGRLPRRESPAHFFGFEIYRYLLGRSIPKPHGRRIPKPLSLTIPKQGALSFTALRLGAFPSDSRLE
jgi:hypothetical protein